MASAAAAATAEGDKTATGTTATETAELAEAVAAAGRASVESSLLAAARLERLAAAEAESAARRDRQRQHLAIARHHADYLGLRIKEQDLELATLQTALLAASLDGVRSQCGPGPAADELAFALGALYDLQTINKDQNSAVANAVAHLDAALMLLPAPGPAAAADPSLRPGDAQPATPEPAAPQNAGEDPGSSPSAMAREWWRSRSCSRLVRSGPGAIGCSLWCWPRRTIHRGAAGVGRRRAGSPGPGESAARLERRRRSSNV